MNVKAFIVSLSALFAFSSCTSVKNAEVRTAPVYVTDTKKIQILSPDSMENSVDEMQMVLGKFGDQSFTLLGLLQVDENYISLTLFNDFGTDMGTLSYDGIKTYFSSSVFPPQLKAEYVINDLQCVYYKTEALKENFSKSRLVFEESEDGTVRKIFDGKKLIEEIIRAPEEIKIVNHLRGYEYRLIPAEE